MEYIDVYDIHKNRIRIVPRGSKLNEGEFILVVHVCVFNSRNQMLIQKRVLSKNSFPGKWDISVGGTVQTGETSSVAACRELKEEIGIDFDFENHRPFITSSFTGGFDDFYLIECDKETTSFKLQAEEVEKVMWADKKTVLSMIDSGEFISYHKGFIETIMELLLDTD